ncbi:helix-turn-helix domain-containing protein [Psychroflexus aestuariivivens]|uniref:helix-turn-helix domain-containing protein n=1 Tax=Psychroflexus aestuariivivens TaxID=1795040 RepID=UPI000FD7F26B|nr:helix-turn-helix domain-containing protein [Psychroflexus aestuariivivens]
MESKKIQFIELTPEEFKNEILQEIKAELLHFAREIKPKPQTIWLSRDEVAQKLNISKQTLHNWNKSGKLQAYKKGGLVRYKLTEVESFNS